MQVYHHFGNTTVGPSDPYSQVKCSVCNCSTDESLLLLCDLCDSASHTYCVGLGATVPDGDWFCQDCKLLRDEQAENEMNTDPGNQISSGPVLKIQSQDERVCIFDIVREPCSTVIQRTRKVSSDPRHLPPPSSTADEISMIGKKHSQSSRRQESSAQQTIKSNARTLRHCRNVHDRIRVLRKNWNRFRSGALTFSSSRGDGSISSLEPVTSRSLNQPHSSSCLNQQSSVESGSAVVQVDNSRAYVIDKAWEMMEIAKTIRQGREKSIVVFKDSKYPIKKPDALKKADSMSFRHLPPKSQQSGYNELASSKSIWTSGPYKVIETNQEKLPVEKSFSRSAPSISSVVSEPLASNIWHVKEIDHTSSSGSKPRCSKDKNEVGYGCVDRNADKGYDAKSEIWCVKEVDHKSSSCSKPRCTKEKNGVGNSFVDRKANKASDAKIEILSLVKLNLKLQTKDEKLEVDAYKEVARLATHSILAACGLEQPKPEFCSLPGSICSHPDEVRQCQRSTLMPNSCRKCFFEFVKDVVSTILLQKKKIAKNS
ncbi:PHD and RING finger domain-containing -like [Olea europaea subsp. europaea]|uniref:PHD and RING finger domain-containing -like n=1 Tax=Olea europaea subsp. europaea TaxID=158383 RepID=A0A8S0QXW4_OLEEU|nr:PHD and RING finger domain-containing -like [Olea europaea subsp. europaea]